MIEAKKKYLPILKKSKLFQGLNDEQIAEIAGKMYYCEFEKGNALVYEGEMGNELYIIVEGEVVISVMGASSDNKVSVGGDKSGEQNREEKTEVITLAKICAGDFFGEMSMLETEPRSATCSAVTPVRTLVLKSKDFMNLIETSPIIAGKTLSNMLEITAARLLSTSSFATQMIQWGQSAKQRAITDTLTGLFNRRYLDTYMEVLLTSSISEKQTVSFAMVDIDHFGQLNTRYGAEFCDTLLVEIAHIFQASFDEDDILIRYGGDEFCFFIRGELSKAVQQCTSVCTKIYALHFDEHPELKPSCSIGLATYTNNLTSASLLKQADTALYHAKENGRNQVYVLET